MPRQRPRPVLRPIIRLGPDGRTSIDAAGLNRAINRATLLDVAALLIAAAIGAGVCWLVMTSS